jgi:HTH-type transcriptional regulator, sugar sensing transcriptional regulator
VLCAIIYNAKTTTPQSEPKMKNTEINEFLEKIGLTEYETKTLTTLFNLKEAEAPTISRTAQVPKTRVYDVLDRLTQKKLIIEIAGRPKKYRTIEATKVFTTLIENKKNELQTLQEKANKLNTYLTQENPQDTNEKIMKVKDKHDFYKILAQEIENAQTSINAFAATPRELHHVKEAIKNNPKKIELKVIGTTTPENTKTIQELTQIGTQHKENNHGIHAYIIDNKKIILALSDFNTQKNDYHFTIWPEHKPLANALNHYFNKKWNE